MPRFVVLEHDYPNLHWDLMVECEGVLRTWRLAEPPADAGAAVQAEPSSDHRLVYLEYEGCVSGNRGIVRRWDGGTYALREEKENSISLEFAGRRLKGPALLTRNEDGRWRFLLVVSRER